MDHPARMSEANGFPVEPVRKTPAKPQRQQEQRQPLEEEEPLRTLHIPYVRGLSEKIEKTCAPFGVKAIFKPGSTLKQMLVKVKLKMPEEKKKEVAYQVPCMDCPKVYTGETKRPFKVRIDEYKRAVKKGDEKGDEKHGITVHAHTTNHNIHWEGARVQGTARGLWKRRTLEAIQIRAEPQTMNLDCGLHLSPVWNPIINSYSRPPPPPT
jgi:hypothetical protein